MYLGSMACSTSTNAAMPPVFWALAIMWNASVVLPDDSGPYISTMRPRGTPPIPVAISREREPVGMTSIATVLMTDSPSFIIEPFP
ncbi:MAG: hypothetical protein ACD_59C00083G0001 [uncultured bacterium]|nr:MAG: hypothetical protein ACD_59C00083G0001 [uncultured bacterium]